MTALNFHMQPNEIYIAMDTLAISPKITEPFLYTTKFYLLPHLIKNSYMWHWVSQSYY
jgi:hypothetical protein